MYKISVDLYHKYSKDLIHLINHFTESDARTQEVMSNLKSYIENQTALIAGHIINDRLASFIWCYEREFAGHKRLHISYFIVDDSFRGEGLSKDLLNFAIKTSKELKLDLIDLNVDSKNDIAIKVYEKAGFNTENLQMILKVNEGDEYV